MNGNEKLNPKDVKLVRQDHNAPDFARLCEMRHQLDDIVHMGLDFHSEEGRHLLNEILRFQDTDGSFKLVDSYEIESDARVVFCHEPTYICTALLIEALLDAPDVFPADPATVLAPALQMCCTRGLQGHGFDSLKGFLQALSYFIYADVKEFLRKYPDMCPEFTAMIDDAAGEISGRVARKAFADEYGDSFLHNIATAYDYFFREPVFVYGTLLRGQRNHDHFLSDAIDYGRAVISGYEMYDLGSYPGIIPGGGEVYGEVYSVDAGTLRRLDELESEGRLYRRVRARAVFPNNGSARMVQVYVYNHSTEGCPRLHGFYGGNRPDSPRDMPEDDTQYMNRLLDIGTEILDKALACPDSGTASAIISMPWKYHETVDRFRGHKKQPGGKYVWYACYGSNVNYGRFMRYIRRCTNKTPPAECRPFLLPYSIYFAKFSSCWNGAPAFLDVTRPGTAYGRIYKITENQYHEIKKMEGPNYTKRVSLGTVDGLPVYSFTDKQKNEEAIPSAGYFRTILDGLRETWAEELAEDAIAEYLAGRIMPKDCLAAALTVFRSEHAMALRNIADETGMTLSDAGRVMNRLAARGIVRPDSRSAKAGLSVTDADALFYTSTGDDNRADSRELLREINRFVER